MFDLILITRNYYKRLRSEKIKNAQLREVKLESDLKVLQSQINPHFLFNSLNVLVSEIYFDQERAVSYIQHLSDIYRYVLQSTQKNLVDIETELDFLHSYIYMFKTKYDDGFQVKIDIANDLLHRKIPPLALQILVENSIKHNAILPGQPLIIKIYTTDNELIISNNINKKNNVSSELTGLKNLNTRYKILANKSIIINSNETEFKVVLPLL
jgi:LytS/YehU family sensor histidine kinase